MLQQYKMKEIKVKGRTDLVRNSYNKAIINTDDASYERRISARNAKLKQKKRLMALENEVTEIKTVLNKILDKLENKDG